MVIDHVIPTSNILHGAWNASTDSGSGLQDYQYRFFYSDSNGEHGLGAGWTTTTATNGKYTLTASDHSPSTSDGRTYYLKVKARDKALNSSNEIASDGVTCHNPKVGFFYWVCQEDSRPIRSSIDSMLSNTSGIEYDSRTSTEGFPYGPDGTSVDDSFDVLFIAQLTADITNKGAALQSWVNRWHKRVVLLTEPVDPGFPDDWVKSHYWIDQLARAMGVGSWFSSTMGMWFSGIPDQVCNVNGSQFLTRGVSSLRANGLGDLCCPSFTYVAQTVPPNAVRPWIMRMPLNNGGDAVLIYDTWFITNCYSETNSKQFISNVCKLFE